VKGAPALALVALAACGGGGGGAPAAAPAPAPAAPAPGGKAAWPYAAWDRAEAIVFNQVPYGPGAKLYAFRPQDGWNPTIASRASITAAQAAQAIALVEQTTGDVEVSKCAFPRHAIVLLKGDVPVASINVCFECGDLLVWPAHSAMTEANAEAKMAAYDVAFPKWQALFRDELGLAIEPPAR
jgi:hypothetical protein